MKKGLMRESATNRQIRPKIRPRSFLERGAKLDIHFTFAGREDKHRTVAANGSSFVSLFYGHSRPVILLPCSRRD